MVKLFLLLVATLFAVGSSTVHASNSPIFGTFASTTACFVNAASGLTCWGQNTDLQVSQANAATGSYQAVAAGIWTIAAINSSGAIQIFGETANGQGSAPTTASGTFVKIVPYGYDYGASRALTPRGFCALRTTGIVACWGTNVAPVPGAAFGTTVCSEIKGGSPSYVACRIADGTWIRRTVAGTASQYIPTFGNFSDIGNGVQWSVV